MTKENTSSNGVQTLSKEIDRFLLEFQGRDLEANVLFPPTAKSAYKSSDFTESFDFPFNPDPLAQGNNYRIYDEMRDDDQVKAAISTKKDILLSPGWTIKCEDEEIADTIIENLKFKTESSFEESLRDILSAFEYGFSISEVIYRKPKDTGLFEIKDIKTRPPHTFQFDLDNLGNVTTIRQRQLDQDKKFHPNYFLHHVYEADWGNPYGRSDLRSAHQSWKMKKFFLRMWAIHIERFASPTIVGRAAEGTGTEERKQVFNMLKTLQNSTIFMVPKGVEVEFLQDNRDGSAAYSNAINVLNTMIARAVLVPDLLGISGSQTSEGSLALGKTQFRLFTDIIKKEQQSVARRITLKIIRPLVLANWGDIPCTFEFNAFDESDVTENLKLWTEAAKGNIWKPSDEEINHFKETVKFPVTDTVERPDPAPVMNPIDIMDPNDIKKDPKKAKGGDDEKDNPEAREAKKKLAQIDFLERKPTKFEEKIDFAEITRVLDAHEQKASRSLKAAAVTIYEDILTQIKDKNIFGNRFKPDSFNQIKPRFQKQMKKEFNDQFSDLFKKSFNMAQKEFFKFADPKFAEHGGGGELLPEEFLELIEAESFKLVGDYSTLINNKAKNTIVLGIKNGLSESAILKELRKVFVLESDRWLKVVVRTKTTEMFNRARKSFYDNDEIAKQIIEAFEFSAILDSRTSAVCDFLDGQIFEKGELVDSIVPPLHFQCRSLLVPITKFEDFKSEKGFVPRSKEPSLDLLKSKGGNLILISNQEMLEFKQALIASDNIRMPGNILIISSPGSGKSIQLIAYHIANMSTRTFGVVGLMFENADDPGDIRFQQILNATEVMKEQFIKDESRWVLPENTGLFIHNPSGLDLEITIKYKLVLPDV